MSLLTNEQINDILDITNVCESSIVVNKLNEWNEKQTGTQINVNWSRAPDTAIGASVSVTWVIKNGFNTHGYHLAKYDRPPKPITPHPHAEMIMKYAEVAQRRVDPWVEFEITLYQDADYWSKCPDELRFLVDGRRYRHIGETK